MTQDGQDGRQTPRDGEAQPTPESCRTFFKYHLSLKEDFTCTVVEWGAAALMKSAVTLEEITDALRGLPANNDVCSDVRRRVQRVLREKDLPRNKKDVPGSPQPRDPGENANEHEEG